MEMLGNGNKGMETVHEAWPRVALARVRAMVGGIFGNDGQEVGVWQELG